MNYDIDPIANAIAGHEPFVAEMLGIPVYTVEELSGGRVIGFCDCCAEEWRADSLPALEKVLVEHLDAMWKKDDCEIGCYVVSELCGEVFVAMFERPDDSFPPDTWIDLLEEFDLRELECTKCNIHFSTTGDSSDLMDMILDHFEEMKDGGLCFDHIREVDSPLFH